MLKARDKEGLANFIGERFNERYIAPFARNRSKNGFIMMASACLMIEALESFHQGWKQSPNSPQAFDQFFARNIKFHVFKDHSRAFYKHVRSGILHQGETTGGWRVRRDLPIVFIADSLSVDASRFMTEVKVTLADYCASLRTEQWNDDRWRKAQKKLRSICSNALVKGSK